MLQVISLAVLFGADFALFVDREADVCPDEAELRAMLVLRLGQDRTAVDGTHVISVRFATAREPAFVAHVTIHGPAGEAMGEKTLRGDDCADLGAAVALTLSVVLHDRENEPAPAPFGESPPRYVGKSTRVEREVETQVTIRRASVGASIALEGGAAFEAFTLPMAAFGAELGLALQVRWFSLAARARVLRPLTYATGPARVDGLLLGGLIEACGNVSIVSLCGVLSAGALRVTVRGLAEPREMAAPWVATGTRVGVRLAMGAGITVRPHATLILPLLRTGFLVDNSTVWASPAVALGLGVDVAYGWSIP